MDGYLQQWLTLGTVADAGLRVGDLWMAYLDTGGTCDIADVEAYLHGLLLLPRVERDIVAHTVNELLDGRSEPFRPAPYSNGDVSTAAGYSGSRFDRLSDRDLERLVAADPVTGPGSRPGRQRAEARRLESLHSTGLLGTLREERFDRITRRARQEFAVSSASIALIGQDRQIIKSVNGPIGQDLPRDVSFCNQTIRSADALVVTDALHDERFRNNPLVQDLPRIRFYAGCPLTGPGGWRIGTLCVIDDKPRGFSEQDEQRLRSLAGLVQQEISG
ncbi:GAF domain-containing protein [Arthrobacter sp. Br18]|uniref:GAF domain-containing protein n=1 Tax=Arthrobacter sp. Br18 TaxID=1312954 RepID=UPI0004B0FC59|nr:GAF domain-containing protein [Arthrobacter sp. Br18]